MSAGRPTEHVAVKLDDETLARVEALIPQLTRRWHEATRSDVLRMLIKDSLARIESDPRSAEAILFSSCSTDNRGS